MNFGSVATVLCIGSGLVMVGLVVIGNLYAIACAAHVADLRDAYDEMDGPR